MEFHHVPIMLERVLEELNIRPDGIYLDGTVGGAGHSSEILKRLSDKGRLICLDQDDTAVAIATERLAKISSRATVVKSNFVNFASVLDELGIAQVDGILLDLGVSSHQLDNGERGFSYRTDAPLDMRLDQSNPETARDIVNNYSEADLTRIFREYGEEPFARQIAANICRARQKAKISTTFELNELIRSSIPARARRNGGPLQTNLSGNPDRTQPGAAGVGGFHGSDDRTSFFGRKALHHHIPFFRGPDRKTIHAKSGAPMHLSAGLSGVCMRQGTAGQDGHEKAYPSG